MERLKTIGWLVLVLAILAVLLLPAPGDENDSGRPTTDNLKSAGVAGLQRWLQVSDVPTIALRQRFTQLPGQLDQAAGNVLLLHLTSELVFEAEEIQVLLEWVAQGNSLVIAAGLLEGSSWIYSGVDLSRSLWRLTGLGMHQPEDDADDEDVDESTNESTNDASENDPSLADTVTDTFDAMLNVPGWLLLHGARESVGLVPTADDPLVAGLEELVAPWDGASWVRVADPLVEGVIQTDNRTQAEGDEGLSTDQRGKYAWSRDVTGCAEDQTMRSSQGAGPRKLRGEAGCISIPTPAQDAWRVLLQHADSTQAALYSAPIDDGQVLVLLHPSILSNEVMHRFGNRELVMNLVTAYVLPGAALVFDDAHQGAGDIYTASEFLSDPRFYASVAFVLLFWFAYILGNTGFWDRVRYRKPPVSFGQRDLVQGSANFLQQRLHPQSAQAALLEPLAEHLANKWRVPREGALAAGLALERRARPAAVAELQQLLDLAEQQRTVSVVDLRQAVHQLIQGEIKG